MKAAPDPEVQPSRRWMLQAAAGMAVWTATRAGAQATGAPPAATVINSELKQLAPTVYAFLQREAKGQSNYSVSNFGIVVGPQSLSMRAISLRRPSRSASRSIAW
jgi:hypothetical protein